MDFSAALTVVKDGGMVRREYWGNPELYMRLRDGQIQFFHKSRMVGEFLASSAALLADDWHIVKREEVGLDPSDSGKILHGDEVDALQVPAKVVPIKGG